jgi:GNAT superfamily N-acetyltransferase
LVPETTISEKEESEFEEFLHNKIKDYNNDNSPYHREARKPGSSTPLNIILKDNSGNIIGGLSGSTYWDWLDIDDFYVPEEFRGKGIGASLLQTAESIAVKRGCRRCFLSTFEFQGRVFNEKQGYYVTGKLEDYPPGSAYYWMRKDLLPEQS